MSMDRMLSAEMAAPSAPVILVGCVLAGWRVMLGEAEGHHICLLGATMYLMQPGCPAKDNKGAAVDALFAHPSQTAWPVHAGCRLRGIHQGGTEV